MPKESTNYMKMLNYMKINTFTLPVCQILWTLRGKKEVSTVQMTNYYIVYNKIWPLNFRHVIKMKFEYCQLSVMIENQIFLQLVLWTFLFSQWAIILIFRGRLWRPRTCPRCDSDDGKPYRVLDLMGLTGDTPTAPSEAARMWVPLSSWGLWVWWYSKSIIFHPHAWWLRKGKIVLYKV